MEAAQALGVWVPSEGLVGSLADLKHSHPRVPRVAGQMQERGLRWCPDRIVNEIGERVENAGERLLVDDQLVVLGPEPLRHHARVAQVAIRACLVPRIAD